MTSPSPSPGTSSSPLPVSLYDIEQAAIAAWPALEVEAFDGWLWRYSRGGSQRANSISCLDYAGAAVYASIAEAERRYAARSAPARFQITEITQPSALDTILDERGYACRDVCTTLQAPLSGLTEIDRRSAGETIIEHKPSRQWMDVYTGVITPDRKAVAAHILARVPSDSAFCAISQAGRVLSTTLCVVSRQVAIIECVASSPDARRQGAARAVVEAAMRWASARGAVVAALGALADNAPAQALYRDLGFTPAARYHTRIQTVRS